MTDFDPAQLTDEQIVSPRHLAHIRADIVQELADIAACQGSTWEASPYEHAIAIVQEIFDDHMLAFAHVLPESETLRILQAKRERQINADETSFSEYVEANGGFTPEG